MPIGFFAIRSQFGFRNAIKSMTIALMAGTAFVTSSHAQNVQPFNPTPTEPQILAALPDIALVLPPQVLGTYTSMTTFGESFVDTGNEARIRGYPGTLHPGQTFGRNSNGFNAQDAVEYHYGIAPTATYNYAVGGARTDGGNTNGPTFPGYPDEIQAFLNSGRRLGPTDLTLIEIGGNDALALLFGPPVSITAATALGVTSGSNIAASVATLVGAGARNIAFMTPGSFDPSLLPPGQSAPLSAFGAAQFNTIEAGFAPFAQTGTRIFLLNTAILDGRVRANPGMYGFTEASQGCLQVPACAGGSMITQNKFYSWDGLHHTTAGYALLTSFLTNQIDAPSTITPQGSIVLGTANSFAQSTFGRLDAFRTFSSYGMGGAYAAYAADMPTKARPMKPVEPNRWSVFGEATYAGGTREASLFNPNSSFSAVGGDIGLEYQVRPDWKLGGVFNYARPETNLGLQNAHFKADAFQWTGYSSYTAKNWFADALIAYGRQNINTDRKGVIDIIDGSTHADLFTLAGRAGYLFDVGAVRVGPIGGLYYATGSIAGYTETGDFLLTQIIGKQNLDSLTGSAGVQFRLPFAMATALYNPYVNVTAEHDFLGDGRIITTTQTSTLLLPVMTPTNSTNQTYGKVAAGISGVISGNVSGMINAFSTFARADGNYYGVSGGIKVAF